MTTTNECSRCTELRKERLDKIRKALPAASIDEISATTGIESQTVAVTLSHLREYAIEHGWTVPHAKRGPSTGEDRFFVVRVDASGQPMFDKNTEVEFRSGAKGTASEAASKLRHQAVSMRLIAQRIRSRTAKRLFRDLADDFDYTARKTASATEALVENGDEVEVG